MRDTRGTGEIGSQKYRWQRECNYWAKGWLDIWSDTAGVKFGGRLTKQDERVVVVLDADGHEYVTRT